MSRAFKTMAETLATLTNVFNGKNGKNPLFVFVDSMYLKGIPRHSVRLVIYYTGKNSKLSASSNASYDVARLGSVSKHELTGTSDKYTFVVSFDAGNGAGTKKVKMAMKSHFEVNKITYEKAKSEYAVIMHALKGP